MRVRGRDWRVDRVTAYDSCAALHLGGIGNTNAGVRRIVLHPFDRAEPLDRQGRTTPVTRGTWLRALQVEAAAAVPWGSLRGAASARIDLLPYQFEPALALLRGLASRVLLADAVGLGKTIQAALLIAELRARDDSARTLVVTPAGLREQWAEELEHRFSIQAQIMDALELRRRVAALPRDVNPWEVAPVVITSLDFVKLPEVCRALDATVWDLLVVDEAHLAATAPERRLACEGLAARARWVALLTATPHTGDEAAFASLCSIGNAGRSDPILVFRRAAGDVGVRRDRRVHMLRVRPTSAETELHVALDRYTRLVWERNHGDAGSDARLAMIVLRKRALSAMSSLVRSLTHRLENLGNDAVAAPETQLPLPLSGDSAGEEDCDDEEPLGPLGRTGLGDAEAEREWLENILAAARRAVACDSKAAAVTRLLERIGEAAIVFTEYRDTAISIAGRLSDLGPVDVLHGGLDRAARRTVEARFRAGATRILVATDVGGQGLNLHERCRVVINLELPWNPMRLEQRIGRVDRIGQRLRVHAFDLVARGTAEETILARLAARIAAAREAVGDLVDPIGTARSVAAAIIAPGNGDPAASLWAPFVPARTTFTPARVWLPAPPELRAIAWVELERLQRWRSLDSPRERPSWRRASSLIALVDATAPWIHSLLAPCAIGPGVLFLFRARVFDGRGSVLEDALLPIHVASACDPGRPDERTSGGRVAREEAVRLLPSVRARARAEAAARLARLGAEQVAAFARQRTREAGIARLIERQLGPAAMAPVQAGLFDRRELRQAAARRRRWLRADENLQQRRRGLAAGAAGAHVSEPELVLILHIPDR